MKETKKLKEELKEELKEKAIKKYKEAMKGSINFKFTENEVWLIGGVVSFVINQLNKKRLLKWKKK